MVLKLGLVVCLPAVVWIILPRVIGKVTVGSPVGGDLRNVSGGLELVVNAGSEFSLTCSGDVPLDWCYNEYDHPSRSQKKVEGYEEAGEMVSKLTVINAYYLDTGYFICHPHNMEKDSPLSQKIYVYVKDPDNYLAVNDSMEVLHVFQFENVTIPCKPTDPDLDVKLKKNDNETLIADTAISDPRLGFTFLVDSLAFDGHYECCIKPKSQALQSLGLPPNDEPDHHRLTDSCSFFTLVVMPRTRSVNRPYITISPNYPVEGTNVTFECNVEYEPGVIVELSWELPHAHLNQSGRLKVNEERNVNKDDKPSEYISQMTLYNVSKEDEGIYSCQVSDHSGNKNKNSATLSVIPSGSSILNLTVKGPSHITATSGNDIHLYVGIIAHPPPKSVRWYDNEMKPIIGDESNYQYSVFRSPAEIELQISNPQVYNSGNYTLVVENGALKRIVSYIILVTGEPFIMMNNGKKADFYMVNKSYTINCKVFGHPKPNVTWFFEENPDYPGCKESPIRERYNATNDIPPFNWGVKIDANCTGELICKSCNTFGCASNKTSVLVTDTEEIFFIEGPHKVAETANVTLSCVASKHKYKNGTLKWVLSKGDHSQTSSGIKMQNYETEYSYFNKLSITNVSKSHSRRYSCTAILQRTNKAIETHHILEVKDLEMPMINKTISTKEVLIGESVTLFCPIIRGFPSPTVTWSKNGEKIPKPNEDKFKLHNNSQTLIISAVLIGQEGEYKCSVDNMAGSDELIIDVIITGKFKEFVKSFFWYLIVLVIIVGVAPTLFYCCSVHKYKKKLKELKELGLEHFEEGKVESINPELGITEQADLLPYNREKWEFPLHKLKLGKQLGAGAFGVVLKAEAYELLEPGVKTTVAVKMVKRNSDVNTILALASELKIMIHLGKHLNVLNVLGACTGDLNKRELLVLVEYCRYGNLRNYLLQHRGVFINQVNPQTGKFDPTFIEPTSPGPTSIWSSNTTGRTYDSASLTQNTDTTLVSDIPDTTSQTTPVGNDGYLIPNNHEWRSQDRKEYLYSGLRSICTQDLICWSFQIARGMEYLASRKVLHGDLAARNVLLSEDNIVKICDFGLSKSIYRDSNYQKKGDGPLPIKWLAVESIRDQVFSTQSDIWSYGVTLWELFSLACTPYPGMEANSRLLKILQQGYRMEPPKYATAEVYKVMVDCWHQNPHSRPSFTEIAERMGGMLEDTVKMHYVDLNDPYVQQNSTLPAQQDYLSMLQPPQYVNWNSGYTEMSPASPTSQEEDIELTPMLPQTGTTDTHDSQPDSPVIQKKPIGKNYVNVADFYSNPSYQNQGRPKKNPYGNLP